MNLPSRVHCLLFVCLVALQGLTGIPSVAQVGAPNFRDVGIPTLRNYNPKEYQDAPSNYCALQDRRGVMYIGNVGGLLEYDGVTWRNLGSLNDTPAFSLGMDSTGRVYAGMAGEIGYLEERSNGQLQLISMRSLFPKDIGAFGQVYSIEVFRKRVYFLANEVLLEWDGTSMRAWKPVTRFRDIFVLNGRLVVSEEQNVLYELSGDGLQVSDLNRTIPLRKETKLLPVKHSSFLLLIGTEGCEIYSEGSIRTIPMSLKALWRDAFISDALMLPDSSLAISTRRKGLFIINLNGDIVAVFDKSSGLRSNTITSISLDNQHSIWCTTFIGITQLEWPVPVTVHDERLGLQGITQSIIRHRGDIYAATTLGLFRYSGTNVAKGTVSLHSRWQQIPGMESLCWSMLSIGEDLLISSDNAVYRLRNGSVLKIAEGNATRVMCASSRDPNRVFVGGNRSLFSIYRKKGTWSVESVIEGIEITPFTLVETPEGSLWAGSPYEGALRIDFSGGFTRSPHITHFDHTDGLPGSMAFVLWTTRGIVFATNEGLYRFDRAKRRFVPETRITFGGKDTVRDTFYPVVEDGSQNLWMYNWDDGTPGSAVPQQNGSYAWNVGALGTLERDPVYCIFVDQRDVIWLGRPTDIIRYDRDVRRPASGRFQTLIRSVRAGKDSLLFAGFRHPDSLYAIPALPYRMNSLRFDFAALSYSRSSENVYQYYLEGYDDGWSEWTKEPQKEYTNLPEREYIFHVRSRNVYGEIGRETAYAFRIHPPWYSTWWMNTLYLLALALVIFGIVKLRTRQIEGHKRVLEKRVEERTEQIQRQTDEIKLQKKQLEQINSELVLKNEQIIRTQQQLITQEKLASLGSLTAGIAHEIQNPLNFVTNFAVLNDELAGDIASELSEGNGNVRERITPLLESLRENTRRISEHGIRASAIIRSMLQHSRLRKGEFSATDVNRLLDESVSLAYHGMRGIDPDFVAEIERDYDDSLQPLTVVPEEISRVFLNLVNNAYYAVNEKRAATGGSYFPTVWIRTRRIADGVEILIRDNGNGIPETNQAQIFQPFFTTKPAGVGTGLGLSISYDIVVQLHQGSLDFHSEKGEFTEFTVCLPNR